MSRVLGIDPGTRKTGWGIIEPWGPRAKCIASGVINAGDKQPLERRLLRIQLGLQEVIETHAPQVVAVEDIFYAKHANAALKLGHARGVALVVAASAELEIFTYPPALVKRTVAGRGRADKDQVGRLVKAILNLDEQPPVDAADALAIALTHVQAARSRSMKLKAR